MAGKVSQIRTSARLELIATAVITLCVLALGHYLDLGENWMEWAENHEDWEIDEIPFALAISSFAIAWFAVRRWREHRIQVALTTQANAELHAEINRRMELEADLRSSRMKAETAADDARRASEVKSQFLANMSHEIRTPLNGVLGMLGLLSDTSLDERQTHLVRTATGSARGLLTIINDILDISKLEDGKLELEESDFNVPQLIDEVMSITASTLASRDLSLVVNLDPELPDWLRCDEGRLRQILFNLVGNAIKFTERGSVTVSASHQVLSDGGLELRCEVQDTGIGISAEAQDELFSRFTQADGSISRKFGGTGLGLAICRELAELMGGTIGVRSAPGKGSLFWVTLRCSVGEPQGTFLEGHLEPVSESRGLRILAAEDNAVNQLLLVELLESFGHSVEIAGNGREAVEAVEEREFDLILMDIQMPLVSGVEATRSIRQLPEPMSSIPIIALSANAMSGQREEYLAAGMNDYLSKPIDAADLRAALLRWRPRCAVIDGQEPSSDASNAAGPAEAVSIGGADADGEAPVLDVEALARLREALDEASFRSLISAVPDQSSALMKSIECALAAGDLDGARRAAHSLRGMASSFAAQRIAQIAHQIECEAATVDEAKDEAAKLERAIDETQSAIAIAA
jgi:signal transduction histidine kinase/CheY-like chemotaxis protein/HPt (histidine-containing phosphotransfer) domain-containing protein